MSAGPRIFGIVGWKNTGKTTLTERLVAEITRRGHSVSTVKHAHHDAEIDHPGRDTHRHRMAGAHQVILSSPRRWALMTELRGTAEPSLADLLARLAPVDLILIEGYKAAAHRKIEAHRPEAGRDLLARRDPGIRAVASTCAPGDPALAGLTVPVLALDDVPAIADLVLLEVGL